MRRRMLAMSGCLALAVAGLLAGASPADAAAGGGGCQLAGSAAFTPNGPGATATYGYSVTGQLTGCQATIAGAPASGTLEVGQQVTVATANGPATYAEPLATGSGALPVNSCPAGTTAGTSIVRWPDGTTTVVDYTTSSAGPAVNLQGTVVPSVTLTLVSGPVGTPSTYTISTTNPTFPVNDSVQGALAFTTSDPTVCTTTTGLTNVDLQGTVGMGSTA